MSKSGSHRSMKSNGNMTSMSIARNFLEMTVPISTKNSELPKDSVISDRADYLFEQKSQTEDYPPTLVIIAALFKGLEAIINDTLIQTYATILTFHQQWILAKKKHNNKLKPSTMNYNYRRIRKRVSSR